MSDTTDQPKPEDPNNPGMTSQQFSHQPLSARVPERVARGVHSTGCLVLDSPTEFVIDFMQGLTRPYQVVARVVVHPAVMAQLAAALAENVGKYAAAFGMPPAPPPPPPNQKRPTIQEIYENFKLPEEQLSGNYANSVMIGHTQSEFYLDFITGFYPTAAVNSRVFVSATQAPRVLDTLKAAMKQHAQRQHGAQPPPQEPPADR
jgi:uncharacterized protein DUF3467